MSLEEPIPTSAEVDRRLRIVSELRNLCVSLGRARPVPGPSTVRPEVLPGPVVADSKSAEVAP